MRKKWKESFRLNVQSAIITNRQPWVEPGIRGRYHGCSHYFPKSPLLSASGCENHGRMT